MGSRHRQSLAGCQLFGTYSIVARDPDTGEMGVAAQSHHFSVGSAVPWAEPGVGAVATQAFTNRAYGPRGLGLLRSGMGATEALARLLAQDDGRELRQVAVVSASGDVAVHTGSVCVGYAGHRAGAGFAVQGNMLESEAVLDAMGDAYAAAAGALGDRLLTALAAAERAGGDVRGQCSAAMRIVSGRRGDHPWDEERTHLRVEDHPDPVAELKRLHRLESASRLVDEAMQAATSGDLDGAERSLATAGAIRPEDAQIQFWSGIVALLAGRNDAALESLRSAIAAEPAWQGFLERLVSAGFVPSDSDVLSRLDGSPSG